MSVLVETKIRISKNGQLCADQKFSDVLIVKATRKPIILNNGFRVIN